jgi:hypothetical protein
MESLHEETNINDVLSPTAVGALIHRGVMRRREREALAELNPKSVVKDRFVVKAGVSAPHERCPPEVGVALPIFRV